MNSKSITFKSPTISAPPAEKWIESRARPDVAVPLKRLTLDLPADLHRRLKTHCAATGLNMADLCRDLIVKALPADAA
jgi:hypothetical protein